MGASSTFQGLLRTESCKNFGLWVFRRKALSAFPFPYAIPNQIFVRVRVFAKRGGQVRSLHPLRGQAMDQLLLPKRQKNAKESTGLEMNPADNRLHRVLTRGKVRVVLKGPIRGKTVEQKGGGGYIKTVRSYCSIELSNPEPSVQMNCSLRKSNACARNTCHDS